MTDNDDFLISPVYGTVVHRNFVPLYVDERFAELYGLASVEEAMAIESLMIFIDESEHQLAWDNYRDIMAGKIQPRVSQFRNIDNRGDDIWVLAVERIVDWQGEPALQVTLVDMTLRVKAEERLKNSEQKFRDITESSLLGMLIHRDFKPLYTNQAFATMHGYDSPEAIIALPSIRVLFANEQQEAHSLRARALMEGQVEKNRLRLPNLTRDGKTIWVDLAEYVVEWNNGPAILSTVVDVTEQYQLEQRLKVQADTDELTGLANRRKLMNRFEDMFRLSRRYNHPLSCILMDLDRFKSINDGYGHAAGDKVLKQFADICQNHVRDVDIVGRYGGEEFLAILPETSAETAWQVAERLRIHTEQAMVESDNGNIRFTVSLSVAQLKDNESRVDQLIERADKGLYQAKAAGRNQVKLAV